MKKAVIPALLLTAGLFVSLSSAQAADGTMLGNTCAGCHGTNGASVGPASPTIAGLKKDTFVDMMKSFKSGDRPSTIMKRIAEGYTDDEVVAMAEFFESKPYVAAEQSADADKAAAGKKLHKDYCEKCHEENGTIDSDGSAILAGQWKAYLDFNLADFNAGDRPAPKKMAKKIKKMVDKHGAGSLEDLSNYYASQK
jgi:sulfide dehydrogenase cytochrome subunit